MPIMQELFQLYRNRGLCEVYSVGQHGIFMDVQELNYLKANFSAILPASEKIAEQGNRYYVPFSRSLKSEAASALHNAGFKRKIY